MSTAILAGLAKTVVYPLIEKFITGKEKQREAKRQYDMNILEYKAKELEVQGDVITTEMVGNDKQRNWRPDLMYLIMSFLKIYGIYLPVYNYVLRPIINAYFGWEVPEGALIEVEGKMVPAPAGTVQNLLPIIDPRAVWSGIPPQLWNFLQISVGGYVLSRGVEKSIGMAVGADPSAIKAPITEAITSPLKTAKRAAGAVASVFDRKRRERAEIGYSPQDTMVRHEVGGRR